MRRPDLLPDCGSCAALCCVATSFEASEDFAFDKPAGVACRHVTSDHRCAIHAELAERGCSGCTLYDCYGAGQRATRLLAQSDASMRDAAFLLLRELHELLWLMTEAARLCPPSQVALRESLVLAVAALDAIAGSAPSSLVDVDLRSVRAKTHALLREVGRALGGRARLVVLP